MKTIRPTLAAVVLAATLGVVPAAHADDNCGDVKNQLSGAFPVVHWGGCGHPDPVSADIEGAAMCAQVIAQGAAPTESGHRTVTNWTMVNIPLDGSIKVPLPNTYIGYCGGTKVANQKLLNNAQQAEVKKQIDLALKKQGLQK